MKAILKKVDGQWMDQRFKALIPHLPHNCAIAFGFVHENERQAVIASLRNCYKIYNFWKMESITEHFAPILIDTDLSLQGISAKIVEKRIEVSSRFVDDTLKLWAINMQENDNTLIFLSTVCCNETHQVLEIWGGRRFSSMLDYQYLIDGEKVIEGEKKRQTTWKDIADTFFCSP